MTDEQKDQTPAVADEAATEEGRPGAAVGTAIVGGSNVGDDE